MGKFADFIAPTLLHKGYVRLFNDANTALIVEAVLERRNSPNDDTAICGKNLQKLGDEVGLTADKVKEAIDNSNEILSYDPRGACILDCKLLFERLQEFYAHEEEGE